MILTNKLYENILSGLIVGILLAITVGIFATKDAIETHLSKIDNQIAVITTEVHNWNEFTEKRFFMLENRVAHIENLITKKVK